MLNVIFARARKMNRIETDLGVRIIRVETPASKMTLGGDGPIPESFSFCTGDEAQTNPACRGRPSDFYG